MVANEKDEVVVPEEVLTASCENLTEEDQRLLEKYSRTFIGSYAHSLDAKGRLVVPQGFRELLGKSFCIAPSFDFQSIALYPTLLWARMRDKYEKLNQAHNSSLKRYLEQLDALSYRGQECDNQGRVLLPAKIRACILKDEKDVDITGANDHVRVVAHISGDEQFKDFMTDLPGILADINALEL